MIMAVGIDLDHTFCRFVREGLRGGVPVRVLNLRAAVDGDWRFDLPSGRATLRHGGATLELAPEDGYYCRIINLSEHEPDANRARRWHALLGGLQAWLDVVPGQVVNRVGGDSHNSAKPLHEAILLELGFRVPESMTSSDRGELIGFTREGPTISKTVCGVRAEATVVTDSDFDDFAPESGPVHLQRMVTGSDARIHVVGDAVVAQRVTTTSIDYRQAGVLDELEQYEPPSTLRDLLIEATRSVGLAFAGWDFKIDEAGDHWCLEVNPMPGYAPYDSRCGGDITRKLLRFLDTTSAQ